MLLQRACTRSWLSEPVDQANQLLAVLVMAFVDTSGVTEALGFPVGTVAADVSTGASLLMNLKRAEILHRPALGSNSSVLSQSRLRPQYTAQE